MIFEFWVFSEQYFSSGLTFFPKATESGSPYSFTMMSFIFFLLLLLIFFLVFSSGPRPVNSSIINFSSLEFLLV